MLKAIGSVCLFVCQYKNYQIWRSYVVFLVLVCADQSIQNWSSVEHIPRMHIAQSIDLLSVHSYNFVNLREIMD